MKRLVALMFFITANCLRSFACDCVCVSDCSFHEIVKHAGFVALVKVISYDNYLEEAIAGHEGKMPLSMTVEVVKKYKGSETRKRIKIWGDDGALCRPYTSNFEIGGYYLIAPDLISRLNSEDESKSDYEFFSCSTDYLKVDIKTHIAYGGFSGTQKKIGLLDFEKYLKDLQK